MPTIVTDAHTDADGHPSRFRHEAMLYAGERGFAEGALRFLREGIAQEEPALVVVAPEKISLLREALGADAAQVHFEDMTGVGANPARIIPAWSAFVREQGGEGRPLRGIGEPISAERSAAELFECQRHESLLNLAFADAGDFRLVCPYDVSALDPAVVAHARCTHPLVQDPDGSVHGSTAFHGIEAATEPCRAPLPPAPSTAQAIPILPAGLTSLRAVVARRGTRAGLTPERREDLVLAVNELATNSIRHGGGAGTLTIWETDSALVCEVTDTGRLDHPLAGRELPRPGQIGRYGLWLVNQLCDLTEQRALPRGNLVRVWMRRG
ncbi:MAG TPA: sensor histidine kinase [Conexibacter sp.]|nr:sensor histidine kinase [Conexibacter sp.]